MAKQGRPSRDEAEQWLRLLIAHIVKGEMDRDSTLEDAAQRAADWAAHAALDVARGYKTGATLTADGFSPELVARILEVAPVGPPWLWRISASTAKKAYTEHFGDGSRRKTDTGTPE